MSKVMLVWLVVVAVACGWMVKCALEAAVEVAVKVEQVVKAAEMRAREAEK